MEIRLENGKAVIGNFGVEMELTSPLNMYDTADFIRNRTGLDIRVETYNHVTRTWWKIVTDSSVRATSPGYYPMEIVSPILHSSAGLDTIKTICAALNELNCKVNRSCGLHVHHEALAFGMDKISKMIKYYKKAENVIDQMMPVSRRANNNDLYCRTMQGLDENVMPRSRFYKVNFESLVRHNTVEFRQHAGTTDAEKIINWVILTGIIMYKVTDKRPVTGKEYPAWSRMKYQIGIIKGMDEYADRMAEFYYKRIEALK